MSRKSLIFAVLLSTACSATAPTFGARAERSRQAALEAASAHASHLWRDTSPYRPDGSVAAYIEIPAGTRDKFEYRMASNQREIDRVLHPDLGGYPVNYGMIPGTLAYDGDPLDVLVLGPALPGGEIVPGVAVGVMDMDDEKGPDPKVVVVYRGPEGTPAAALTAAERRRLATWFNGYKRFDADRGKWARVTGWRDATAAIALIDRCRSFFEAGQ